MQHLKGLVTWFVVVAFSLGIALAHQDQQTGEQTQQQEVPSAPEVTVTPINESFYMISTEQPSDSTILLHIGDDGALLVDSHWSYMNDAIRATLTELTEQPVRYVINTHWHPDHTDGNENFHNTGAVLFAHENVRTRMAEGQVIEFFGFEVPPYPEDALPNVTFSDEITMHVNGEDICVFYTAPAHTDGDAVVYFPEANIVHMGDVYLHGIYPFIDTSSGGDAAGSIEVLNRALEMINEDTVVVPGHGPLSNYQELRDYRDMFVTVHDRVQQAVQDGQSLEQVIAAKPTAEFDARYNNPPFTNDAFLMTLYGVLSQQ